MELLSPLHLLVVIAIYSAIHATGVSSQTPLEDEGIEVKYNISRDAVLSCTVKDLGRRRIIWRRLSDPYPISVGGARFSPNRKYRVVSRGDTSTLTIRRVRLSDAAEYLCEASGGAGPRRTITINIQTGDGNTHFESTDVRIVAQVGDTVVLPCYVENIQNHVVLWKNEKNDVLSLRKRKLSGDIRFRVVHDTRTQWSMQLRSVREEDFGFYTCVVNTNPVLTRTVELKNVEPAKFSPVLMADNSFRKRVEAKPGETVILKCAFNAYPPAEVTWYKRQRNENGKTTKIKVGKGSEYTLRSVTASEAGDYVCVGNNGMGRPSRGKTRLVVVAPKTTPAPITTTTQLVPRGPVGPHLYHVKSVVSQTRGRSAVLECIGVGQPRPQLEWWLHGKEIKKDYKYNLVRSIDGPHRQILRLEIRSLTSRDFATYKCQGHNNLGLRHIDFKLEQLTG